MSEHTHTDTGLHEEVIDVSKGTQAQGAMAESELLVEHLLGIRIPHHIGNTEAEIEAAADMLAEQVTYRVLSGVDQTRTRIDRADLRDLLDERITHALANAHVEHHGHHRAGQHREEHLNQARAIADAIRDSIPEDVIDDLVRNEMTVALDVTVGVPKHCIEMRTEIDGVMRRVRIDTRNSFWRERSFASSGQLTVEIQGKTIGELGITVSHPSDLPPSYVLTHLDAGMIVTTGVNAINPNNTYNDINESVRIGPDRRAFYVNIHALVAASLEDHDTLRQHKYVGNLNRHDLAEYFLHNPDGNFSFWNRWVHGLGNNPLVVTAGGTRLVDYVVDRIFQSVGTRGGPGVVLATRPTDIFEIQKQMHQQHVLDVRLKEGSDNKVGAAMATLIASRHPDIRTGIAGRDRASAETEMNTAAANKQLLQMLEALEALPLPTGSMSFSDLEQRVDDINTTAGHIGGYGVGQFYIVGSPAETFTIPANARGTGPDYGPAYTWIYQKKKEAEDELKAFKNIEVALAPIADFCTRNAILGTGIQTIVANCRLPVPPAPPPNRAPNGIAQNMDLRGLVEEIRVRRNLGTKTKADLDKDVERLQKELKDIDDGKANGPHGDTAQHLVIKEYLKKYRGLSESDATAATNYLRARSVLDSDLSEASDDAVSELYGHERLNSLSDWLTNIPNVSLSSEARSKRIVYQIAYASHVPMRPNQYSRSILNPAYYTRNLPEPNWAQASYRSLMEAYFAMKKMYEGGGPGRIKLQQTEYVQRQMRDISRALLAKHAQGLLRDFGPSLGISDEKQKEVLKNPTKAEHIALLSQMLQGEAPAAYSHKVDHAIGFANQHTDWIRHTFLTNEKYGMLYGKQNKISARSLLYGNKYASAKGLLYDMPINTATGAKNLTVNSAKAVWARKGAIAAGALIGTLFLPGIGTAIGAAIGGGTANPQSRAA